MYCCKPHAITSPFTMLGDQEKTSRLYRHCLLCLLALVLKRNYIIDIRHTKICRSVSVKYTGQVEWNLYWFSDSISTSFLSASIFSFNKLFLSFSNFSFSAFCNHFPTCLSHPSLDACSGKSHPVVWKKLRIKTLTTLKPNKSNPVKYNSRVGTAFALFRSLFSCRLLFHWQFCLSHEWCIGPPHALHNLKCPLVETETKPEFERKKKQKKHTHANHELDRKKHFGKKSGRNERLSPGNFGWLLKLLLRSNSVTSVWCLARLECLLVQFLSLQQTRHHGIWLEKTTHHWWIRHFHFIQVFLLQWLTVNAVCIECFVLALFCPPWIFFGQSCPCNRRGFLSVPPLSSADAFSLAIAIGARRSLKVGVACHLKGAHREKWFTFKSCLTSVAVLLKN